MIIRCTNMVCDQFLADLFIVGLLGLNRKAQHPRHAASNLLIMQIRFWRRYSTNSKESLLIIWMSVPGPVPGPPAITDL